MASVRIQGENGRALVLSDVSRDGSEGWAYSAGLELETGGARIEVWDHGGVTVADLLAEVARRWRGWDGALEYHSVEGHLSLACTHDGLGTITCAVTLAQLWPPTWSLEAELSIGAGAHAERIAADAAALFASAPRT